jgi:hypothetical protein
MPGSRHGPGGFADIGRSATQAPIHLMYVTHHMMDNPDSGSTGRRNMEELKHGCIVRIKGLVSATQHNGKEGVLIRFDMVNGRWGVEVGEAELLSVKPASLEFVREPVQIDDSRSRATEIDYMQSLCALQHDAILRGDRYTLCPDCAQNEAAGNAVEHAMCRNAAFRLRNPNKSFSKDNIVLVCCAVNQIARNQDEATPLVKHKLDLLAMRFQRSDARAGVPLGLMTCKRRDQGGM